MRHKILISILMQALFMSSGQASPIDEMNRYVESLKSECTYDDGYACAKEEDINFFQQTVNNQLIPAQYLSAWGEAYETFGELKELTQKQKDLKHYKIGFAKDGDHVIVYFSPLMMPYIENGQPSGVSRVSYGKEVKIWVNSLKNTVTKYLFLK